MSSKADSPWMLIETVCDGVFAIIIALLVLEIHRPSAALAVSRANYCMAVPSLLRDGSYPWWLTFLPDCIFLR
jgi:Endosomal/lysosomal potassium channel TMEM175